jgi:hypothetical protein
MPPILLRLRALTGPLVIGLAVWCAAGVLTVVTPESAVTRLAAPAPWWLLPIAASAAAFVPAWRRRPMLAAPALLTILAWVPVPLPAIALIWTGPLAWAPIGFALVAAIGVRPVVAGGRAIGADDCRRAMTLSAVATLVAGAIVAWAVAPRVPGGDEPHYLAITQSLIKDGDLRIENNHHEADYVAAFGALKPDFIRKGRNGAIYSVHAPGLPVLVLPAFAIFGYRGAQAMIVLLSAIAGSLMWRAAWRVTKDTNAAWFAWAAIVGSTTFLIQSVTVFPDLPGAVAVAAGVLLLLKLGEEPQTVGTRALLVVSAVTSSLPWLHTRFAILAGVIGLLVVWRLVTDPSRSPDARRARVAAFLCLPLVSAAGWLALFQFIYGTPDPTAPYGDTSGADGTHLRNIPGGLTALLFDEQFGLVIYAPVLLIGLIAVARAADRRLRRVNLETIAIVAPYLAAVASYWMWWAGRPAPPARFATAMLPALAPGLAVIWMRASDGGRKGLLALLGVTLAITAVVVGVDRGSLAWNDRDAHARWLDWLGPVANLARGWPSFFWKLNPQELASEVPFAVHVGLWLSIFVVGWLAIRAVVRRRAANQEAWRVMLAMWLLCGAMGATQAGWWLNGVRGLAPARSQTALLSATGPVLELSAFSVRRIDKLDAHMIVPTEEPGVVTSRPPWLIVSAVPPGTYMVHVTTSAPRSGQLLVTVGRASELIQTLDVQPVSRQAFELKLPAGAGVLTIAPDAALGAAGGVVYLEPIKF